MIFVYILDFANCKTEVISINETDNIEEKLLELGYDLNNIVYMVSDNLRLEVNI